ncbi:MAG: hypothetical protein JWO73_284 [Candidatus Taylorbacteria bacterium]|nr:hypothetical protein [Candidatus Taylorbacteria bacterium]
MKPEQFTAKAIQDNIELHLKDINDEFRAGFEFLKKYPKSVTIFGSARLTPTSSHYHAAEHLAYRIVKDLGYSVITGGGPGIMEAANKGARDAQSNGAAHGSSLGICIKLPQEQSTNKFVDSELRLDYFFTRKALLTFAAEAYLFFPGGFGTFDELFGIITLIQTRKIPRVPVILVGNDFWKPLAVFIKHQMLTEHQTISLGDENLFIITEDIEKIVNVVKHAPVSNWWEMLD